MEWQKVTRNFSNIGAESPKLSQTIVLVLGVLIVGGVFGPSDSEDGQVPPILSLEFVGLPGVGRIGHVELLVLLLLLLSLCSDLAHYAKGSCPPHQCTEHFN